MLIIWYLVCFKSSQVPCTAPSQSQMYDVLWKELGIWIKRMPEEWQELFDLQRDYVRSIRKGLIFYYIYICMGFYGKIEGNDKEYAEFARWQSNPFIFIEYMWGLLPTRR